MNKPGCKSLRNINEIGKFVQEKLLWRQCKDMYFKRNTYNIL